MGRKQKKNDKNNNTSSKEEKKEKEVLDKEEGTDNVKEKIGIFKVAKFLFLKLDIPKSKYIIPFLFSLLLTTISLYIPLLYKEMGDMFESDSEITNFKIIFVSLTIFTLLSVVINIITQRSFQKLGITSLYTLRQILISHLQKLSMHYYDTHKTGKINSLMTNDAQAVNNLISSAFINLILQIIKLFGSLALMLIVSPKMSSILIFMIPILFIMSKRFSNKAHDGWKEVRESVSKVSGEIHETIEGLRTIKASKSEDFTQKIFVEYVDEERAARKNMAWIWTAYMPANWVIGYIFIGIALIIGGYAGESFGVIFAFIMLYNNFINPLTQLANFFNEIQNSVVGGERLMKFLQTDFDIENKSDAKILRLQSTSDKFHTVDGKYISFENVTFSYGKEDVLKNINISVKPNKSLAIVGPTGAGKTTFAALIPRFYDIQEGAIKINDIDIRDYTIKSLRENIGMVLQDNYLFAVSIMENIMFGKLDATEDEVYQITKKIGLHDFIMNLPKGYDTVIGERGAILSIGQRQLIAFARTLISDPPILVLDEATSSVDAYSEILIQEALKTVLEERTCILIAHRLSTIVNAENIIFMEDGKIAEQGNHAQLIKKNGLYANYYNMQFSNK